MKIFKNNKKGQGVSWPHILAALLVVVMLAVMIPIVLKSRSSVTGTTKNTLGSLKGQCFDPSGSLLDRPDDAVKYFCACTLNEKPSDSEKHATCVGRSKAASLDCPIDCEQMTHDQILKNDFGNYKTKLKQASKDYNSKKGDGAKDYDYFGQCCAVDENLNIVG